MNFNAQTRHLLLSAAVVFAAAIELLRGYRWLVVVAGALGFLVFGNLAIYLLGTKERRMRRQRKQDYYAGKI
jgi:hypothetical protein